MKYYTIQLRPLVFFLFVLLFPILTYSQPRFKKQTDDIVCRDYLGGYLSVEERKTKSELIIAHAPNILQGIVLDEQPKIIEDALCMEILLKFEHSFRGIEIEDTIISLYRKIYLSEGYRIVDGKILPQIVECSHPYRSRIHKGLRFIFFCNDPLVYNDKLGFPLYTEDRTSYLYELPSKGWLGLFCMVYLDYDKLMNHFNDFAILTD